MKKLTLSVALLTSALLLTAWTAQAASAVTSAYVSQADQNGTNSVVIWPGANGKTLRLTSYTAVGDNADAALQLGSGSLMTLLTAATGASTDITVASTNGFAGGDVVVLQSRSTGSCKAMFVASLGTLKLVATANVTTVFAIGDYVWRMSVLGTNVIGSATVRRDGDGIWGAQVRAPLMLRLYTGAGTTEVISATCKYDRTD